MFNEIPKEEVLNTFRELVNKEIVVSVPDPDKQVEITDGTVVLMFYPEGRIFLNRRTGEFTFQPEPGWTGPTQFDIAGHKVTIAIEPIRR